MHEPPATNGGRPQGAMERTLVELAIGTHQSLQDRRNALVSTKSGEYTQQVQVALSGLATVLWGFADVPVSWEHPFVYSPLQRDPPFQTPHVTSHIEFNGTLSDLVVAHAHVIKWLQSPEAWYIGATLRVAVQAPNKPVAYSGVLHATFQGYAFPTDEELNT